MKIKGINTKNLKIHSKKELTEKKILSFGNLEVISLALEHLQLFPNSFCSDLIVELLKELIQFKLIVSDPQIIGRKDS